AVCSNIESLHRMTREERNLEGVKVNGSDHLTAYRLFAEAVNRHGYLGEVYGLPRHLFDEEMEEWAERRGVLVKAIEDVALGTASVFRALGLELPNKLPDLARERQQEFIDLVARIMPFDLVIDEHTADGQEARVSRGSMAGSWGAVAGGLRYFADRYGISRAAIEGTTVPYDLVRRYAVRGSPRIELAGSRRDQHLVVTRRLDYFGFELEQGREPLHGEIPPELHGALPDGLVDALMAGETIHPDQPRLRRALDELGELWRRSGGNLMEIGPEAVRSRLLNPLKHVTSWEGFLATRLSLEVADLVSQDVRARLMSLPSMVRLHGDAVPLDYEIESGTGVVRLRLREGQGRRLHEREISPLDRPVRFTVVRGRHPAVRAGSLAELRVALMSLPRNEPRARPRRRRHR